jgi:periplasmic protein CpxP/Spy
MTSIIKSTTQCVLGSLALLGLMATSGFPSYAQTTPEGPPKARHGMMHEQDPVKRQEMRAKRQAELKTKLQLTPAQEPAWNTFVSSMTPPIDRAALRAEMEKLPEAERRSKMQALRAQREASANAFSTVLSADQKKVLDELRKHRGHGHGRG